MREYSVKSFICFLLILGLSSIGLAQDLQFKMPNISAGKLGWGRHTFPVKIINNSGYLKFAAVFTSVSCLSEHVSPERKVTRFYSVFPEDSVLAEGVLHIPGNYGEIVYEIKLYEVVDTLDMLLESQVVDRQSGELSFPVPSGIAAMANTNVTLPPLVGQHVDFDNNFSLLLPFLIKQSKSVLEIAKMTGCDTSFVIDQLNYMTVRGYFQKTANYFKSNIAAISEKEAAKGKDLAFKVAESIAKKLADNYAGYRSEIDKLVKAEMLTKDSNSFMDGGAILYKPYPVVTCLLLWYDLGGKFISGDKPFYLLDGTDFCNAYIPSYMYMVAGSSENNGHQHFAFIRNFRSYQLFYGDTIPKIICPEGFMFSPEVGMRVDWQYERSYYPEGFMADTNQVRPMLNFLGQGILPLLKEASVKLSSIESGSNREDQLAGYRYWFWNLVSTRVVEILTADGTLAKHGNGQFRIDGMGGR